MDYQEITGTAADTVANLRVQNVAVADTAQSDGGMCKARGSGRNKVGVDRKGHERGSLLVNQS